MKNWRFCSDFHSEHADYFVPPMVGDKESNLGIPGDVLPIASLFSEKGRRFFKSVSEQFENVFYVPGNHEYYGGDLVTSDDKVRKFLEEEGLSNVHYLNPGVVEFEDYAVVGAALWTDFEHGNQKSMKAVQNQLNDYYCIRYNNSRLITAKDTFNLHREHLEFIMKWAQYFKDCGKKVVVMTHHAPSRTSIHPRWMNTPINGGFVSDLNAEILELEADIWVHGHCHDSFDYMIGNTRVLCNPRGYAKIQNQAAYETWRDNPDVVDPESVESGYIMSSFSSLFNYENKNFNPYLRIEL